MSDSEEKWVLLDTFTYMHEYLTLKVKLESEGIETFVKDEMTITIDPLLSNAIGGIKLYIKESDSENALKIYQQFYENTDE